MTVDTPDALELLAVGESMVVLVPDDNQPLETASTVSMHTAGAESNVVHYLAQRQHHVGWLSRLGDDPFGRRLLAEFSSWGVKVSDTRLVPGAVTGVYFKDPVGSRQVYYYRKGSAASAMSFQDVDRALSRTRRVHVSGITAALSSTCAQMLEQLMDASRERGVLISFDVNFRPTLWTASTAAPVLKKLALKSDLVFVGRDEAEELWGTSTAESVGALLPVPELVVKDGAVGATAFLEGSEKIFQSTPVSEVVEPVGAGDAFAAGYLSGTIGGFSCLHRLRLGHIFAISAISSHADNAELPSEAKISTLMQLSEEDWTLQSAVPEALT